MKQRFPLPLKLNLGCGFDHRPGWVNVDVDPAVQPDLIHDLYHPLPFADQSVTAVHAQDILEHFTNEDGERVIADIARVLRYGGTLTVRVPNVDDIIHRFARHPEVRNLFLYGDTSTSGVFGAHKVGFTPETLLIKMMRVGLYPVALEKADTNLVAEFRKQKQEVGLRSLTFMSQTSSFGGAEVFAGDLLTELNKEVRVSVVNTSDVLTDQFRAAGVSADQVKFFADVIGDWKGLVKTVVRLPLTLWQSLIIVMKATDSDVLLLSGFTEKLLLTPLAWLMNVPVVWIEFGPLASVFRKFGYLPKILYRFCKDLPDLVIVPSKNTRNHLIPAARMNLAKVRVIPCGRKISIKKGSAAKPLTIACVSRLEPGKGHDLLITAMAKIVKKLPRAQLLITGGGVLLPTLRAQVEQLHLQKHVQFLGRVEDALPVMANAHVCVFPSVWELEGFGLVTIEAMALGKPVVAFATGPTPEIIQHHHNGLLTNAGSSDDLAAQIMTLLQHPAEAKKLALQAQHDFRRRYTITAVAKQYLQVLSEVILRRQAQTWLKAHS